ncbi:Cytochrome P450 52A13-like protein 3 [Colletotrichum chlorophyti]|uniref:Cytochrome P450 52A13-like protein 3 n=1 Tax=Colletotrichum chlorophyti TaxID=708187 RepID=A0A1Q8RR18_9PEZI|nr:Cytochrome P450 52A13-like protein 3 [Colletotrichum chlorophyti]
MYQISLLVGAAAALYLLFRIFTSRRQKWLTAQRAQSHGCLPPPSLKSKKGLQFNVVREAVAAVRDDRGPQFVAEEMDRVSPDCHTVYLPIIPLLDYGLFVTRDPENFKALYQSADFDISASRQDCFMPLLGRGILTSRGDVWKHSRALVRPQFAKDLIGDLGAKERHVSSLMDRILVDRTTGWTEKMDLQPLLFKYSLDQSTEFLYAQSTNSLSEGDEANICEHLDAAKDWIEERGTAFTFSWLVGSKDFKNHCKVVHDFVDAIVARHLRSRQSEKKGLSESDMETGRFSLLDELAKCTSDPLELRNETLHLLSASKDTTACLISWAFYHLSRNQNAYQRLREEVKRLVGSAPATLQELQECEYLQWVINETLRITPVIAMNDRVALADCILPRGGGPDGSAPVMVPKGTQVLMPIYAVQHRRDLWGADADTFRPERWETLRPGPEWMPFSGGRRKCLGREWFPLDIPC